jgi:hypothetical protein
MAYLSYDDELSTDRDKVRFYVNDKAIDAGPLPGDGNFSDNELDGLIDAQGSWERAVAACFDALETAWANYADKSVGPRSESMSQIAERWAKKREKWVQEHGLADTGGSLFLKRIDQYSDDVPHDEIDDGEYTSATDDGYFEWRGY